MGLSVTLRDMCLPRGELSYCEAHQALPFSTAAAACALRATLPGATVQRQNGNRKRALSQDARRRYDWALPRERARDPRQQSPLRRLASPVALLISYSARAT